MSKFFVPANSPEDWKPLLAEPDKHWKTGYSAKSLAYRWQGADDFPDCVRTVFNSSGIKLFQNMKLLVGFPEYKVPLPGGIRASQSDIFLLAKGNNQLASITVEGKVSETFGPTIEEWITDYGKGKEKRLKYLCGVLGLEEGIMTHIRYQLVHRTASAVIEAKEFNAHTAMMLVHSFSSENQGFEDYKDFLNLFNIKGEIDRLLFAKNIDGIDLFFCWVKDNLNFALRPGTSFLEELVAAEEKYGALAGKLAKLPPQKP